MQCSYLFVELILPILSTEHPVWNDIWPSKERLSNTGNFSWRAEPFWIWIDMKTAIEIRKDRIRESLSQGHNRRGQVKEVEVIRYHVDSDDSYVSPQFLQRQKKQLIDL